MTQFIGREEELQSLEAAWKKFTAPAELQGHQKIRR